MEVENRIESFGGQVDELPDELKDRRQSGGSGGHNGNVNAVILEESEEDSRDGLDAVGDKNLSENCPPVNGRVIKKVIYSCNLFRVSINTGFYLLMSYQLFSNLVATKNLRRFLVELVKESYAEWALSGPIETKCLMYSFDLFCWCQKTGLNFVATLLSKNQKYKGVTQSVIVITKVCGRKVRRDEQM